MMARKRNYAAEYAARNVRAKARGFTGYAQERPSRVALKKEFDRLTELGVFTPDDVPKVGSPKHELVLRARAEVLSQNKGKFVLGKEKLSLELKNKLKKAFPEADQLHMVMCALYSG